MHDDNYGVTYDPKTFKLLKFAPCFDHNMAFDINYERSIAIRQISIDMELVMAQFIPYNKDIVSRFNKVDMKLLSKYLDKEQMDQMIHRMKWLHGLIKS